MALAKVTEELKGLGNQKWVLRVKASAKTGERYLPAKAIKSLTPSEYAATTRAKREGTKAGKQHVAHLKRLQPKPKPTGR